nr:adenosine kinase [Leptinotarsa decemlineata]
MAFMDGVFVWHQNLLVGVGNPLLDMSAVVSKEFLAKYGLKENDAILADKNHMSLYTDLVHEYQVTYTAGGSVQNTLRVAQWLIGEPFVTTYFGCVGMDKYSRILFEKATDDGVNVRYQQCDKGEPTGTCAVLITDHNRSLCANLGCANNFTIDHIRTRDNKYLIDSAKYYYISVIAIFRRFDTNGAGDAFVGGFLSQYIQELNLETCVKCGMWAASQIIQRSGCTFEGKPSFIYTNY